MKQKYLKRSVLIAAIFIAANVVGFGQKAGALSIDEKNVRAEMGFLASDAMQGRGSGTIFERVAAEYIGSQFMQFGLEPAGEMGPDGKQTYVQTVDVAGRPLLKDVTVSGAGSIKYGTDMVVMSITAKQVSGELQKIKFGDAVKSGAIVLVSPADDEKFTGMQEKIGALFKAGAVAVIIGETSELREQWSALAGRDVSLRGRGNSMFALSKAALTSLSAVADGTKIDIAGTFSEPKKAFTWNAMGKITGTDKTLASEVILLTSHLDHLGVRESNPGDDKIFNGADDDASGSVAVLELARVLGSGAKPKRTVYFVCFGSEEAGGFGATYFVNNMPFPKDKLVANLEFEMIGRPDAKVKPDELWLTGYERSNLGPELAKRGAKLVQDPHPEENFFQRSDNIQLARAGIIAHTVSSFGLHTDYHHASDELKTIDFVHMTRSIDSMVKPVQWLINSPFKPVWNEGKKP
ncbi:MAG: M20/M25/M40 family metallo-hydrolase [Pyrinomonadaceae bacterium]